MSDAPRPVSAEPRRRTKKACLTCQRKKLKCNGLQPCATCSQRSNQCLYASVSNDLARRQAKQQLQQHQEARLSQSSQSQDYIYPTPSPQLPLPQFGNRSLIKNESQVPNDYSMRRESPYVKETGPIGELPAAEGGEISGSTSENGGGGDLREQLRMLQDGRGRLLYLGDSASLSYLGTIRRLVESTLGQSDFTIDPNKNKLVEGTISTSARPTHVLPDREAAEFLLESFFSNTVGTIHIFDREALGHEVAAIYENPLQAEQSRLSILNLVFAVGLQLTRSSAAHGFREGQILKRLDGGSVDRAVMFYLNATHLNDLLTGFEDGDITSIQALLLITVFMLTVAKRMAVRSAYALGLHSRQTAFAFTVPQQHVRKNVWRSLYVMDCFLSAMLGRLNAIDSRDATDSFAEDSPSTPPDDDLEVAAITASVRASRLIGDILSNVYADRKISLKLAYAISKKFQAWKNSLPSILQWQNINLPNEDPRATLAQLHVNLNYFHGIILLTRPFFLQKIVDEVRGPRSSNVDPLSPKTPGMSETGSAKADPFQGACVRSAVYSIDAIQAALLKQALPRRDPFVIYWLFTAALIVFSNGFCTVYRDIDNNHAMQTALNLHRYFADVDPLARRFLQILVAFDEAISRDTVTRAAPVALIARKSSGRDIFTAFFGTVQSGAEPASVDGRPQMQSGSNSTRMNVPIGNNDWENFSTVAGGVGFQPAIGQDAMQQRGSDFSSSSPPDYSLDFDAFLTSVSQDPAYQQDLWMPIYGTTDMS